MQKKGLTLGFNVQLKNNDAIIMTLESPSDVKASFMQAVENALKRRVIKFEIDIAQNLGALEEIFLQLVALQKVLGKRGERLLLIAHKSLPAELEAKLHEAGVELKVEQEIKSLSEANALTGPIFGEFYKQARLKNWPRLEEKFKAVYEELKGLIQTERALQKEIEFYKKRIISLRPLIPESLNLQQLADRSKKQEVKVLELSLQNENLQLEIAKLAQDLQSKQAKYKALIKELEESGSNTNQKGLQ